MFDPVALRSLVSVSHLGSVAAAADALGYTPSAVSQQIKRLEAQSGVQLLEKAGRGVMLTEPGRLLVDGAGRLLEQMEQITAVLQSSAGQVRGSVRLALFSTACRGLVAPALVGLRRTAPEVTVSLVEVEPWDAVDLVAAGQVELAVVHNWEPLPLEVPAHLERKHLGTDVADVLVHSGHSLSGRSWLTPRWLVDEDWVSVAEGSICHQWLQRMFHDIGAEPRIVHRAMEFGSHVELVAQGLAVALVPRLGRGTLPPEVVAVPVRDPVPTRTVTALWRRTMSASPSVDAVVRALVAAAPASLRPAP